MIIYDIEIEKAILGRNEDKIDGIEYCDGWHDHAGMGISCICAYDYRTDRDRVFLKDNFSKFQALVNERNIIVGFNSIPFDNCVCRANGIQVPDEKSYDILREIWAGAGLGPKFVPSTHGGYGLDRCIKANLANLKGKSGNGALAPVQWQRQGFGSVIDYCLHDVFLERQLLDHIIFKGAVKSPVTKRILYVRRPCFDDYGYISLHPDLALSLCSERPDGKEAPCESTE